MIRTHACTPVSHDTPHGQPGNINTYVLDVNSDITSFGKHNRLLVFGSGRTITIREDILHGLNYSTEADRQRVAKSWQRLHPRKARLHYVRSETYKVASWESIDHTYTY